jgi:3-hydroxymyristoyl/3-hydroxydecanoyl-(acyl carrier protein) dehydratase
MIGHFGAFSFVDRITGLEPGKRARGRYAVPSHLSRFSPCLALEAGGQLAAWIAMAGLDFRIRPVAGVASGLRFGAPVKPGQTLDLRVEIDSCDEQAVSYSAWAHADGVEVMAMEHSVGPMLPMEEFDAPDAVRNRFELLCAGGAPAGTFWGVPEHDIEITELAPGKSLRTMLRVPRGSLFFSDHFARRPVFPATLLLDAQIQVSLVAAAGSSHWPAGASLRATRAPDMKIRAFIPPGELVELTVDLSRLGEAGIMAARTSARVRGKQVAMGSLEIAAGSAEQ